MPPWKPRYFDIGVNLSDPMFHGSYHGSLKHSGDLKNVIQRAHLLNVDRMLVTALTIAESRSHLELCSEFPGRLFLTAGVHPCSVASEFYGKPGINIDSKLSELKEIVELGFSKGLIKLFGEIGLDYDRLHYSTKDQQKEMFTRQLELIALLKHLKIPLFLHMRNACDDFVSIIKPFIEKGDIEKGNGVVHSFTGDKEELQKLLSLGFYIGVNGCSLKSEENLQVVKLIPKDKLMIETDAPWCEVRKSHASYKYISGYGNKFYPEVKKASPKNQLNESTTSKVPTPSTKESTPNTKESTPNTKESTPNTKESTPNTKESTPNTKESTPNTKESTPNTKVSKNIKEDTSKGNVQPKKKQGKQPKGQQVKMDTFLPFPIVKPENVAKHNTLVQGMVENHPEPETIDYDFGPYAQPLVKSRNEPAFVGYVAEIMAKLYDIQNEDEIEEFIDALYQNTCKVFHVEP